MDAQSSHTREIRDDRKAGSNGGQIYSSERQVVSEGKRGSKSTSVDGVDQIVIADSEEQRSERAPLLDPPIDGDPYASKTTKIGGDPYPSQGE